VVKGTNPWATGEHPESSAGLEWVLPCPPAYHTFGDQLPVIRPTAIASNFSLSNLVCLETKY
jgi:hypothetical protein